jgi:hypothetical protein
VRCRVADFLPFFLPTGAFITGASDAVSWRPPGGVDRSTETAVDRDLEVTYRIEVA